MDNKKSLGFEINWNCGHRWLGHNTSQNPNNSKKALGFGCPVPDCDCKEGKLTYFKIKKTKFITKKELKFAKSKDNEVKNGN